MAHRDSRIPASIASMRARLTRERLIRLVQRGVVAGERVDGRWLVSETSLQSFIQRQPAPTPAKAGR